MWVRSLLTYGEIATPARWWTSASCPRRGPVPLRRAGRTVSDAGSGGSPEPPVPPRRSLLRERYQPPVLDPLRRDEHRNQPDCRHGPVPGHGPVLPDQGDSGGHRGHVQNRVVDRHEMSAEPFTLAQPRQAGPG